MEERRFALKVAYDGTRFFGFQRQPGRVTVEGYRSSSRTDRGVSALGNVVSIRTDFESRSLCSAVNSELEHVWVYSATEVQDAFNPRAARQRWYRYYLPKADQDRKLMEAISQKFVGVHDFSGYSRRDKRNPMRTIDFRAESFLWNMVRRIVWMVNEGSSGRMPFDMIGPTATEKPVRIGLSPPEYLILMDIDCGISFDVDPRARIGIARRIERSIRETGMRLRFTEDLLRVLG
jgi:tRNA pseudouridine38-40 synthase